jgi:transposase
MKVYIGIDWSEQKHNLCFMNEAGGTIVETQIAHTPEGFLMLEQEREKLGVTLQDSQVGIETGHNLLVDFLVEKGYPVYVLPPGLVKSSQGRQGVAGAKDDRRDARLIADIVRTDRSRLQVWLPQSALVQHMKAKVSLIHFLSQSCVRYSNRLRAVLLRYYPAALQVFAALDTPITLAFVQTYPTPQQAAQLSFEQFQAFLRQHHHCQPSKWAGSYARLKLPAPDPSPEAVETYQGEAMLLAGMLATCVKAKQLAIQELQGLYSQHPDRHIFASLPGTADFLQPALLAKLGDHRSHFPSPAVLQAVAGTSPITRQSGKHRSVSFRFACDRELRFIAQQWAKASINKCDWANTYFSQAYRRTHSKNDAYRRLANRWLAILWKLWQSNQPYDESFHLQQRMLRALPRS